MYIEVRGPLSQLTVLTWTSLCFVSCKYKRILTKENRALLFIAGLILGLQSFCKRQIDYDVETALLGARKTLEFLAVQSPQAAHYLEILTLLSTAIIRQHGLIAAAGKSRYVTRLIDLNESTAEANTVQERQSMGSHGTEIEHTSSIRISAKSPTTLFAAESMFVGSDVEATYNWDHFDITQWDNFLQSTANNQETT